MLRNCFWHSYCNVQQKEFIDGHQVESSSDKRLDDQVKINSDYGRTKNPNRELLMVDEIMV